MYRCSAAPWATSLQVVSAIGTAALVGTGFAATRVIPHGTRAPFAETFGTLVALVPPLVALGALLFVVRGYEVVPGEVRVARLLWSTRVGLDGLSSASHDPSAMACSLRLFGNGGLFSITGLYQNKTLGRYRAFVTDPKRSVVLRLPKRTVVLSPEDPFTFLHELRSFAPGVEIAGPHPHAPAAPVGVVSIPR